MDDAYTREDGFTDLAVRMPCCHAESTLNDLEYDAPQGFYHTRLSFELSEGIDAGVVCARLAAITGVLWRVIRQHL